MEFLTNLLSGLGGSLTAIVQGWQARQTARVEADVKTIAAQADIAVAQANSAARLAENAQALDGAWDALVANQMEHTWKDEWYVVLFSMPLILAFLGPWGAGITNSGFAALATMPEWYFYCLGTAVSATFGMRRLLTLFEKIRK